MSRRAIFLDRDGTLNKLKGYITQPDEIELIPGAAEAVKLINENNYLAFIVTNQGIIARGVCSQSKVEAINQRLLDLLKIQGAKVDALSYCPHYPTISACDCRKPKPGMLKALILDYEIDVKNSYMIGDFESDVLAGKAAELKTIKLGEPSQAAPDYLAADVLEAVKLIFSKSNI